MQKNNFLVGLPSAVCHRQRVGSRPSSCSRRRNRCDTVQKSRRANMSKGDKLDRKEGRREEGRERGCKGEGKVGKIVRGREGCESERKEERFFLSSAEKRVC